MCSCRHHARRLITPRRNRDTPAAVDVPVEDAQLLAVPAGRTAGILANYYSVGEMITRNEIAVGIIEAAQAKNDTRLAARIERIMDPPRWAFRRKRIRERVIDQAIDDMLASGVIVPTPDGVEAAVDWDQVVNFLGELLPVLLQLLILFA